MKIVDISLQQEYFASQVFDLLPTVVESLLFFCGGKFPDNYFSKNFIAVPGLPSGRNSGL
jgi:hypothetical protein